MNPRELLLLSPYRLPTQHSVALANEDVAAFLNGYSALWHPAALRGAAGPPRIASQYDHEQPTAGHVYAVPETPPLFLPDDWDRRVREAGAVAFRASADRATTLANLEQALANLASGEAEGDGPAEPDRWPASDEAAGPFFGLGLGHLQLGTLAEAMEHDNLLDVGAFWEDVSRAVAALDDGDADSCREHLRAAADRLLSARQALYPVAIHLLDLSLPDPDVRGAALPAALELGVPCNLVASGTLLQALAARHPDRLAALRETVKQGRAEVCGGCFEEREDALLPFESQLWNLLRGLDVSREVLGEEVRVFARRRFGAHPQLPVLIRSAGLRRALLLAFDDAAVPSYRTPVVNWPAPDGSPIDTFTRGPYHADNPQTFFHLAHYLHQTIMQDHAATLALLHTSAPAAPWYRDWLELTRLAPVLGEWTTLSRYFDEVMAGEQASGASPDEFQADYLSERTAAGSPHAVSGFARHVRLRRRLDTAWTLAALHRGLAGGGDHLHLEERLDRAENAIEAAQDPGQDLADLQREAAETLAARLLARAQAGSPGYLVLNPCSFARRVPVELEGVTGPLPVGGPLKACQVEGDRARLVVEVPALGFAWVPRVGPPGTPPQTLRMRLADERHVRNEFFEAEIDQATGGLRGIWDHRTRASRLAQKLVYNPGGSMRASSVKVVSTGPALGEVVTEGALLDEHEQVLATFRQRFRAWLGRPVLDLRLEIYPEHPPQGYPWHAYYGARFAWRDERALLLRGVNGMGYVTNHTRPVTPDYLELRQGRESTVLFPGGLPFHQRHGSRMLDVLLVPPGETARSFDLALGLDREHPMQTALGMITPVPGVATDRGPPHVGATGWLFHLDSPNLLLTGLRPAPRGADAIVARLLECGAYGGQAELRCVRDPLRARLIDVRGDTLRDVTTSGEAAVFEAIPGDFLQLRVDFH